MMLAGMTLTSCDENDNAIIDGNVWVKPEAQLVDGGAVVKASSISDLNRMIGRLREAIKESATAGETFTINLEAPELDATEAEHTINIPTIQGADIVVDITIADGAKANIDLTWSSLTPIVNITGEGNATIINDGYKDEEGKVFLNKEGIGFPNINMLSNVTVDLSKALVMNDETGKYEELDVDGAEYSYIYLPINSENCTFKAKNMNADFEAIHQNVTSSTHKNCAFMTLGSKYKPLMGYMMLMICLMGRFIPLLHSTPLMVRRTSPLRLMRNGCWKA